MYTFVKLRNEPHDINYPWKLVCDSMEIMTDHAIAYIKPAIKKGMDDMILHVQDGLHISSYWASAMLPLLFDSCQGLNILEASMTVERDLYETKVRMLNDLGGIYLSDTPSYMPFTDDLEIVDSLVKEDISFPN